MIAPFTLQEEEMLFCSTGGGDHKAQASCKHIAWKAPFSVFPRLFNKNILKQQHAENAAKSAEIDVKELLKLLKVVLQPWWGQS